MTEQVGWGRDTRPSVTGLGPRGTSTLCRGQWHPFVLACSTAGVLVTLGAAVGKRSCVWAHVWGGSRRTKRVRLHEKSKV